MLKNCNIQFKFGRSEMKCTATNNHKIFTRTTKSHKSNKKTQDLLVNTSSGNRALYIAGYRPAQEIESQEYDKNQWFMQNRRQKVVNKEALRFCWGV